MKVIVIDFETYWDSKTYTLSKMNAIDYVRSSQFYAQLVSVSIDGKPAAVYEHDEIPAVLESLDLPSNDVITVGHNINGFDGLILSEVYNIHPAIILDTISMMRWTGVSRLVREQLKSLAEFFGVGDKKPGTVVSDGKRTKADFDSKDWEFFKQYCADDSNMTARCVEIMLPYMTTNSILFTSATAKMATNPSFYIDPKPLEKYIAELDAGVSAARENLNHLFNFTSDDEFMKAIRSDAQFCSMLKLLGQEPPMKVSEKKTETYKKKLEGERMLATPERVQEIDTILADPDQYTIMTPALSKGDLPFVELLDSPDERVRLLVQARLDHKTSVPRSRAEGLLHFAGNRPVPVMLKCFSAHTSRYAAGALDAKSDGIQWQNIPKHNKSMEALRKSIVVFDDSFTVIACDSSQIEARVLAYVAQQLDLLDHFAHGRDIYAEQAAAFGYGMSAKEIHDGAKSGNKEAKMLRQVGKKLILSCLSASTQVLTNDGWKYLCNITRDDKLWDGESWVEHRGIICYGSKETMNLDGVRLTLDHKIFTGNDWVEAQEITADKSLLNAARAYATSNIPVDLSNEQLVNNTQTYYENVYDILNCGKNNRFTVRTEHGALIVHNCGYGTGWRKFADTLLREHTPLSDNKDEHYATAKKLHTLYRSTNKNVVYFWDTCQRVIEAMARGEHGFFGGPDNALFEYGPMTVCGRKDVPSIKLPTGFILRYPNLRLEYNDAGKGEYVYDRILGKSVIPTRIYGGALTENCVQSLAFQILMDQAVEMINRGVKICVNVHDSFSTIVPNSDVERTRAIMEECMSAVPSYVKGLPLACESEIAKDFSIC